VEFQFKRTNIIVQRCMQTKVGITGGRDFGLKGLILSSVPLKELHLLMYFQKKLALLGVSYKVKALVCGDQFAECF